MPTLSAIPMSSPSTARDAGLAVLATAQTAREAASDVFRSAAVLAGPGRASPARAVRALDRRFEAAHETFEAMVAGLPVVRHTRLDAEVELVREAFGKALAALTRLRCEATRPVPRLAEVRFLSAQVYSALAHIQTTVGAIRRKMS